MHTASWKRLKLVRETINPVRNGANIIEAFHEKILDGNNIGPEHVYQQRTISNP